MKKDIIGNISKRRFFLIPGLCTLILFIIAIFFMNQTTKKMLFAHEKENNEYLFEINKQIREFNAVGKNEFEFLDISQNYINYIRPLIGLLL